MEMVQGARGAGEAAGGPAAAVPGAIPPEAGLVPFARALFARVDPEDLGALSADALAALAGAAWSRLQARQPGCATVRVAESREAGGTVVEVLNDNGPFLLDSLLAELGERGLEPRLVAHPILAVERDAQGRLARFVGDAQRLFEAEGADRDGPGRESFLHVHLPPLAPDAALDLAAALERVFADVRAAVADFAPMRARLAEAAAALRAAPPAGAPAEEVAEAVAFLEWLEADNFVLLGAREYRLPRGEVAADPLEGSGLGILRDPAVKVLRRGRELVAMTPEVRAFLAEPSALIVAKANVKSRVHRRAYMDYVGVKLFDEAGGLAGELRLVGLFAATAYTQPTAAIPLLRRKAAAVIERAGLDPAGHSGRALTNVLDGYPRDELFQLDQATLEAFALDVLRLTERPRLRALARADRFDRFVSVLTFIPKDRYDTGVRRRVGAYLAEVFKGRVSASYPAYPEGPLARTHFIIGRDGGETPRVPREELEAGVAAIARTWADALQGALAEAKGAAAPALLAAYAEAFGAAYREAFGAAAAVGDLAVIEGLSDARPRAVNLYRREGEDAGRAGLKVFSRGAPMPLSERVPLLEGAGFTVVNERTYRVAPAGRPTVWLHDMTLARAGGGEIDLDRLDGPLEALLMALFAGRVESDGYNALVLEAGLGWREAAILRALSRYLQQARAPFSQDYMAATLRKHAGLAREVLALFLARFDPRLAPPEREARAAAAAAAIEGGLAGVTSLDEDRILRRFRNLVEATVRTNAFQVGDDGHPREVLAFKLESRRVDGLPAPRPLFEVWVYSPRVEGVHLRFGRVARGGLRWSDRREDFRTEVLGLVKAQQVKNAVIVPVGAKGGFVPKRLPAGGDRAAIAAEGAAAYDLFINALLDLTDSYEGAAVRAPDNTVRLDADDPYLVVAADKGTATFSDRANAIALRRGHWLGDAFASGGSVGYDHKAMGITARGAWEAVKRHFREMDRDTQAEPFTVAGVGDMSGDVFGNGMLLSPQIRLVAAFDHRDIFLDPSPDAGLALAERRRLFELPRSSWADYDSNLLSEGGGVFSRSAKSIPLSPQARAALGFDAASATPAEVMSAILRAPVDLLWFGGIGTYVRASSESDLDAGDRANDAVRVTGAELRAKVVGEGANLGLTQRGRIEAARAGVRLNTDAIDNSAGVNTSDVEVNIKVALANPVADGRLSSGERPAFLASMTEEVADLVLRNNVLQPLALSLAQAGGAAETPFARRLMRGLEAAGRLDRAVEFLPSDAEINARERAGEGLARPELAVLLAYAKLDLNDRLLAGDAPDDPYFEAELLRYFPAPLRERFPDALRGHRLRREIVATQLANAIVNRAGPFVMARTEAPDAARLARAYALARDGLSLSALNAGLDALDGRVPGALGLALRVGVRDALLAEVTGLLRHGQGGAVAAAVDGRGDLGAAVAEVRAAVRAVGAAIGAARAPEAEARAAELAAAGVPEGLARDLADLPALAAAPEAARLARAASRPLEEAAAVHLAVGRRLGLGALAARIGAVRPADDYERAALARAAAALADAHGAISARVLAGGEGAAAVTAFAGGEAFARAERALADLAGASLTVARAVVAAGLVADLAAPVAAAA